MQGGRGRRLGADHGRLRRSRPLAEDGRKRDLLALLDDATNALSEGMRELQLRPRA